MKDVFELASKIRGNIDAGLFEPALEDASRLFSKLRGTFRVNSKARQNF